MRENRLTLPLFEKDAVYSRMDRLVQSHVGKTVFREGSSKKPG
jgi:hypothetical protein